MSRLDKLIERLKMKPKDFTYDEAKLLLENLGFVENNKGKTSGSRVIFENFNLHCKIRLHKPHPSKHLKPYVINNLIEELKRKGLI